MPRRLVVALGLVWASVIVAVTAVLATGDPATTRSQLIGSLAILSAILFCLACSVRAAWRPGDARLGWTFIAIGMAVGALGQIGWVLTAVSKAEATTSALVDAIASAGYFLPMVMAVFAFPRRAELLISRYRQVLDVLVITIGVLLISEATVLGPVLELADISTLAGWLQLAYPVADVVLCALVLCIGMRQLPGDRHAWLLLGSGLLVVAITDSIFVRLLAEGSTFLTATPLAAGWMLGPVLIGMATFIPMTGHHSRGRDYALVLQLLPYLPVVGAVVVLGMGAGDRSPAVMATAALLLIVVMVRQGTIVYENVSLTQDLEARVASRTMELTTLGSIVTSSTDAIVGVSRENRITTWNPAAERLYGYSAAQIIGRTPEVLMAEAGPVASALLERADRGERLDGFEIDWRRPDGRVIPVALTVSPILDDDSVQGISVFAQDITERRREARALEQAREDALASARLKSEFLATMSHEIRTPMNAVIGLTSLLLESELDQTQRTYAEGVQSAGEALLNVINDILDFSKLEAGKVVLDHRDFSPRKLVEDVGALMAPAASAKGLELIAFCLPGMPAAAHGDASRIRQILLNLASNAVKFTAHGEVVIRGVALTLDEDHTRLRFEVIDTGIGIAEKDQGRLFESFSQADASTTRRFGGTGLGLAISRRLVEVMGGEISLRSEVGVGSTFSFDLTLRTAVEPEPSLDELRHDLLADLRVLVVDDNETNRELLAVQLTAWRMRVVVVDNAPEAFEMLRGAAMLGRPYDLAALDAQMPDTDGLELARRLTADPVSRGLPMIMLTSGLHPDPATMRDAGITQWLPKPLRSAELFDRLMRLMAPREKELQARCRVAASRRPPETRAGTVLVVGDIPGRRIVTERIISQLGYRVRFVDGEADAIEAVRATTFHAVLVDIDQQSRDGFETARALDQVDGERRTRVVPVITRITSEDRERCLAAGFENMVFRPLDIEVVESALTVLPAEAPVTQQDGGGDPTSGADGGSVIDSSRLQDLAELVAADGSNLMVSMIDSYVRRSADRAAALERAAVAGDLAAMIAIAHELKGSSGTVGAERVMRSAAGIEQQALSGLEPGADSVSGLIAEMEAAVRELSTWAGRPE